LNKYPLIGKWLAVEFVLLFVGTCLIPAIAKDIERPSLPASRGNWLYVGGSGPGNYTKIQDAVDNASDNDTVFVYDDSSPYYEYVSINKSSISLIGEDKNTTVIDGGKNGSVVRIDADNVIIAGFMIMNGYGGIYMTSQFNTIIGNNICFNHDCGIYSENGISNVITGNTVFENGNFGIYLYDVSNVDIIDNVISSHMNGIITDMAYDINIIDNVISSNNASGANICSTQNCTITGNIISNNGQNSLGHGITLYYSTNLLIRRNTFQNNFIGLMVTSGDYVDNRMEENNFIDNTIQAIISSGRDVWSANYWDNWIGLKFHGPICKRFPKIILSAYFPGLIFLQIVDWHPAQEPYDIRG
jgi:parallel beta-helix repeat protein